MSRITKIAPGFSFDLTTGISLFWFFQFPFRSGLVFDVVAMSSGWLSRNWSLLGASEIVDFGVAPGVTESCNDVLVWLTSFSEGSLVNGGSFHHSTIHNFHKYPYYQIRGTNYVIGEIATHPPQRAHDLCFEWNNFSHSEMTFCNVWSHLLVKWKRRLETWYILSM